MPARYLLTVTLRGQTLRYELASGQSLSVGRGSDCDVCIEDRKVSRLHATIKATSAGLEVTDLGSHNGTAVVTPADSLMGDTITAAPSDHRLAPQEPHALSLESIVAIGAALVTCEAVGQRRAATELGDDQLVIDPAMIRLYELAERISQSALSVLILGESGVGKDVLARFIHRRSTRAARELVSINCGAVAESLLEAELFGYQKGAFTGAAKTTEGLLEAADKGTLFFDEVGELTPSFQVKLLRVLELQQFMRVGGREPITVDVRYLAATNRDLGQRVAAGEFREDLYYRLNGISLTIPSLRERPSEIVPLAERFLEQHGADSGEPAPALSTEARAVLAGYNWPGNVRQLRNVVRRAAVLSGGQAIATDHIQLQQAVPLATPTPSAPAAAPTDPGPVPTRAERAGPSAHSPAALRREAEALERQQIIDALEACAGNQTRAAEMLGLTRRSLVTRLNKYDIPRPRKGRGKS